MEIAVKIALPIPTDNLYTYILNLESNEKNYIGKRVFVQLGKMEMTGVIVDKDEMYKEKNLKNIIEVLDNKPIFSKSMLNFTKWISEYYLCNWGEVLAAATPQGLSPKSLMKINIQKEITTMEIEQIKIKAPKRAALLHALSSITGSVTVNYLEKILKQKNIMPQLQALEQSGIIKCERFTTNKTRIKTQKGVRIAKLYRNDLDYIKSLLNDFDKTAPKQALILSYLIIHHSENSLPLLLAYLLKETKCNMSTIKALVKKKLIEIDDVEIDRSKIDTDKISLSNRDESTLTLTEEQQNALETILESINSDNKQPFLIHGITGSGKTIIYIHIIKHVLEIGKTALIMVPEISLTPQMIDRFVNVFGENIAVIHSRMSQGEKYDNWKSILDGKSKIVIGARSAIFAPLENIGVIIVDEEHEHTFKQESQNPRYNARDCAVMRAKFENALIVLGSATPSIESMYNAETGKYRLLHLTERADGATLPIIKILDRLEETKKGIMNGNFSEILINKIADKIKLKEGVIVLHNRRGFSTFLECPDCGNIPMCKNCTITLTYHKKSNQLRCHYCGYTKFASKMCDVCGYPEIKEFGSGTQRIEDELNELLEKKGLNVVITRMDLDTTHKKGSFRKILLEFANGRTDILVGTQMVAKGLDFERVTLVAVINADLQLFHPDFRAIERTFQLLTQVSGRAGRSSKYAGEVIIQTSHMNNIAIEAVKMNSYKLFYDYELYNRRMAMYPPFSRFVVLEFSGTNEEKVDSHSKIFAQYLPHKNSFMIRFGPVLPSIPKLRNKHRRIIVIKNIKSHDLSGAKLRNVIKNAIQKYHQTHTSKSVYIAIDIDAYGNI